IGFHVRRAARQPDEDDGRLRRTARGAGLEQLVGGQRAEADGEAAKLEETAAGNRAGAAGGRSHSGGSKRQDVTLSLPWRTAVVHGAARGRATTGLTKESGSGPWRARP